jgi:subtilisin family serine protease
MQYLRLLIAIFVLTAGVLSQGKREPYVKNELLVKFREGVTRAKVDGLRSRFGHQLLERLGSTGWQRVRLGKAIDPKKAAEALMLEPEIEAAQPNFYYRLAATPNDPLWGNAGLYGLPMISAPAAWDISTGSSTVVVANIDTGMRYTHEDLAPNMWTNPGEIQGNGIDDDNNGFADDYYGYDFYYNDPDPLDENGHGTHVGGTIGAAGNNSLGVVGVNWTVRIMAIKIYDADGFGTTSAMLINAYNYVRLMKERGINIRVTNNSYAGCDEACGYDQATKDAIDALGDAGILNVFAAGNNNWNNDTAVAPAFPAAYNSPSILTVASSTSTDTRSGFSNWGPLTTDMAAPGSSIFSTTRATDSSYGTLSGTSMAAPHVAGAAALLAAFDPSLSAVSLKATLMNTGDALTGWDMTPTKTNRRLNVFNALQNSTVCSLTVSHDTVRVSRKGGYVDIGVTSGQNCDFRVRSDRRWIRLKNSGATSGSGTVRLYIDSSQYLTRTGSLMIGDTAIAVQQGSAANFPKS